MIFLLKLTDSIPYVGSFSGWNSWDDHWKTNFYRTCRSSLGYTDREHKLFIRTLKPEQLVEGKNLEVVLEILSCEKLVWHAEVAKSVSYERFSIFNNCLILIRLSVVIYCQYSRRHPFMNWFSTELIIRWSWKSDKICQLWHCLDDIILSLSWFIKTNMASFGPSPTSLRSFASSSCNQYPASSFNF